MKTYTVCFDHGAPTWDNSATLVTKDIKAETLEDAIEKAKEMAIPYFINPRNFRGYVTAAVYKVEANS